MVLFATAVGFALIGFFCGSLSGTVVLVVLEGVRFIAPGIVVTLANLITGLVAGIVAGYLVEAFGRRWQMIDEALASARQRTAVIALAVGVVMGVLVGLLDDFGVGGTVLAVIGLSVVSVATSVATLEAQIGSRARRIQQSQSSSGLFAYSRVIGVVPATGVGAA